jgi:hypothetical protein
VTVTEKCAAYEKANSQAAKIIAGNLEACGGPTSLMGAWAAVILAQAPAAQTGIAPRPSAPPRRGQLSLNLQEAA